MAPENSASGRSRRPATESVASPATATATAANTPARPRPLKGRYIPGGPGGGGRYVDADGNEIPVGGTGPGGYNYIGPRGRIGRENLANGVIPPVYSRKDRDRDRLRNSGPKTSGSRRTSTAPKSLAAQNTEPARSQSQRRAPPSTPSQTMATSSSAVTRVVAALHGQGQTPREELGYENFHPDLDLDQPFLAIAADEHDGIVPRSTTPVDVSANGFINSLPVADSAEGTEGAKSADNISPIASVNGNPPAPAVQTPGTGSRRTSRLSKEPTKSYEFRAATTPKAAAPGPVSFGPVLPLNFTSKEKLNLPQPSYRKSDTLARFEVKTEDIPKEGILSYARYMDPSMIKVGYQKTDRYERPKGYIKGADMTLEMDIDVGLLGPGRVEYDMDRHDEICLQSYNVERFGDKVEAITRELFEITITKIEVEWHAFEKRIPKPNPKPPQTHRPRSSSAAAVQGEEPDSLCAICDDGDVENTNAIVFCDGCDLAVHQECYGVPFIPEGQWLCRKCQLIGRGVPTCLFCPSTEGAFKQTPNSKWAHLLCAMWITEVSLGNTSFNEPILDVEKIPNSRWKLVCYICNQRMGACIQCSNKACYQAFHVTCARKARLYLKCKNSLGQLILSPNDGVQKSYCDKHCPAEYAKENDVARAVEETKEHFKKAMRGQKWAVNQESAAAMAATHQHAVTAHGPALLHLNGQMAAMESNKKGNQPAPTCVPQLPSGAPVIPRYIFDIVEKSLTRFNIGKRRDFVAWACQYWTMKREMRRGAALLKRLQLSSENFSSMEITRRNFAGMGPSGRLKLERRIEFASLLVDQLTMLQHISRDIVQREAIKLESARCDRDMMDKTYFPVGSLLPPIIDKALGDKPHTFTSALEIIRGRLKGRYYVSASVFMNDFLNTIQNVVNEEVVSTDENAASMKEKNLALQKKKAHAKKILKVARPMLEEAIKAEAELCGKVVDFEMRNLMHLFELKWDTPTATVNETEGAKNTDGDGDVQMEGLEAGAEKMNGDVAMSSGVVAEETINININEELPDKGKGKEVDSKVEFSMPPIDPMILEDAQSLAPSSDVPVISNEDFKNDRANALEHGGVPWSVAQFEPEGMSLVQPKQPITQYHDDLSDVELDVLGLDADGEPSLIVPDTAANTAAATAAAAAKRAKARKRARRR